MKKINIIFVLLINIIYAQASVSDLQSMGNDQLDKIRAELESIKSDIKEDVVPDIAVIPEIVELEEVKTEIEESEYFGYEYFQRSIEFYDNFPAPSDYRLGPGDELNLSLWGEINLRETFVINKDGLIYYENIGFISLSNKTLKEAELTLKEQLSRIYATIKDPKNSTELRLSIGALKSINVYFSGHTKTPGINLIHPFSDIFTAIVQSGGLDLEGSLRNIQLIRNGEVISIIDFYAFFNDGKDNFSNTKIIDGDVIHIPTVVNRVRITGEVTTPGLYELIESESLENLINHASGLTAKASSDIVINTIIPIKERISADNAQSSINKKLTDSKAIKLNNGDTVYVLSIPDVSSTVSILGRVKTPGEYPAFNVSLRDILDVAGGFDDPIFRKSIRDNDITVLRKDNSQFYGLEFHISYNESDNFMLNPEDKIFVYENSNYSNLFSVSIEGEVKKRGTFPAQRGMTVQDIINRAEGFTELANPDGIIISEIFTSIDEFGIKREERVTIGDATLDFEITDDSIITVLPLENVVSVEGNVYNPGLITFSKGKTVNKYINLAGGPKPNTLSRKIYVQRANGRIKKVTLFQGIGTVVRPGDKIVVPLDPAPSDFDITTFIADFSTTLANIAAILIIVDNQN